MSSFEQCLFKQRICIKGAPRLKIAILVKQVPLVAELELMPDGLLRRDGPCEMDPLSARAVAQGVLLAKQLGGSTVTITLGPPSALDVIRQSIACGVDQGLLVSDPVFRGSDTLVTANILKQVLLNQGPFDIILAGDRSIDGDTGLVPRQIAALLGFNFAGNVIEVLDVTDGSSLILKSLSDDTVLTMKIATPALLTCAERLCRPCKSASNSENDTFDDRISIIDAKYLGYEKSKVPLSTTAVTGVKRFDRTRTPRIYSLESEGIEAVMSCFDLSRQTDTFQANTPRIQRTNKIQPPSTQSKKQHTDLTVVCIAEGKDPFTDSHMFATASDLALQTPATLVVFHAANNVVVEVPQETSEVYRISATSAKLASNGILQVIHSLRHAAILIPDSPWGKEICGNLSATLQVGAVGSVTGFSTSEEILGIKPSINGATLCEIAVTSSIKLFTVTPGTASVARTTHLPSKHLTENADEDGVRIIETEAETSFVPLSRSSRIVAVGDGVIPEDLHIVEKLASLLGAEIACTRRVADKGWLPRSRQVGITGKTISADLYIAIGISGKLNHMIGASSSKVILAINNDPDAPVFEQCDVGLVMSYQDALAQIIERLNV